MAKVSKDGALTTRQVAEALEVSDATIRRWAQAGALPAYEVHSGGRRGRTGLFPAGTIEQARWVLAKLEAHATFDEIRAALARGEFTGLSRGTGSR